MVRQRHPPATDNPPWAEKAKQFTEALKTKDVAISDHTIVKTRVESEPDDDESFVITGLVNKDYDINVKLQVS